MLLDNFDKKDTTLLWKKSKKDGNMYRFFYNESILTDFNDLRKRGVWQFFIKPSEITKGRFESSSKPLEWSWSMSGLIILQHGITNRGKTDSSSLGIVDKVQSMATGEIVVHQRYLKLYNRLKNAIQAMLKFSTISTSRSGVDVLSTSIRMSPGYAVWCKENAEGSMVRVGSASSSE